MKRGVIAIAVAVLTLGSNLALAQGQFSDPYWKDLNTVRSVQPKSASESTADFGFVDRNPAQ